MPDRADALELDSRRRIYQFLDAHPGEHMREIGRALGIAMGTLEYHLHFMVKAGLLTIRQDPRYTRYFVAGGLDRREKDVLSVLRQKVPRQIAAHLLLEPGATHGALLSKFEISASTLSFHLKKLVTSGIAAQEKAGRENRYTVVAPELVARVLVKYRQSFLDDVVDRFAEAWLDVQAREGAETPSVEPAPPAEGAAAPKPRPQHPPPGPIDKLVLFVGRLVHRARGARAVRVAAAGT